MYKFLYVLQSFLWVLVISLTVKYMRFLKLMCTVFSTRVKRWHGTVTFRRFTVFYFTVVGAGGRVAWQFFRKLMRDDIQFEVNFCLHDTWAIVQLGECNKRPFSGWLDTWRAMKGQMSSAPCLRWSTFMLHDTRFSPKNASVSPCWHRRGSDWTSSAGARMGFVPHDQVT